MKTVFSCLALSATLALSLCATAQASDVNKFLPDDAEMVMVFNVKQIMDSQIVKKHIAPQLKSANPGGDVNKTFEQLGLDPKKDVNSVTVSANELTENAKISIIVDGQFDPAKMQAKIEEEGKKEGDKFKIHKSNDRTVYEMSGPQLMGKSIFVCILDTKTVVASTDKDFISESADRAAGKKKGTPNKQVAEILSKMDGNTSMNLLLLASMIAKSPAGAQDEVKKKVDQMENITANLNVSKDLKLGLTLMMKGADQAKEMLEEVKMGMEQLKGILPVLAGQQKELAPVIDLINALKVTAEGNAVSIKGEVSEELIEKGLKRDQ